MSKADLLFTATHEWVKKEGNTGIIGISDYAQQSLGSVVFVDLPSVGQTFKKDDVFGAIESVKAASDLIMPVSGKVIEVNEGLQDAPERLNEDAFENWIIKVELTNEQELDSLLNFEDYQNQLH